MDENLDTTDETTNESVFVSGSECVDTIRKRLAPEVEKRMLALVRSANDSTTDISLYKKRAVRFAFLIINSLRFAPPPPLDPKTEIHLCVFSTDSLPKPQ